MSCGGFGQPCCAGNTCSAQGTSCLGGTCRECTDGTSRPCGDCGGSQTCSNGRWSACASCCPTAVNDTWTTALDTGSWKSLWGDPRVDTTASPPRLVLSFDDIAERNPNYPGGYIITFDVNMPVDRFLIHTNISGYTNFFYPAFYRDPGRPLSLRGMSYNGFMGTFGTWSGQEGPSGTARVTIYVKAGTAMAALATSTGLSVQSGWVPLQSAAGATGNFGFVGTNSTDLTDGTRTAMIGPIKGCAGLSDDQVDALYTAKKQY
jgi:hypothetical protein